MLLSRALLAGPLELPLVSPATDAAATDAEAFGDATLAAKTNDLQLLLNRS